MARRILRRCYRTTIIWYAKLAPTRCNCFIVCECVSSHPANPQLTYESRHKKINPIRMWPSNTMICMQERGNMTMNSQFLTPRTKIQRHPIRTKFQYSLTCQLRNWGTHQEPHTSVPQKFSLKRTNPVTQQIRTHAWNPIWRKASPTNPPQFQIKFTS